LNSFFSVYPIKQILQTILFHKITIDCNTWWSSECKVDCVKWLSWFLLNCFSQFLSNIINLANTFFSLMIFLSVSMIILKHWLIKHVLLLPNYWAMLILLLFTIFFIILRTKINILVCLWFYLLRNKINPLNSTGFDIMKQAVFNYWLVIWTNRIDNVCWCNILFYTDNMHLSPSIT